MKKHIFPILSILALNGVSYGGASDIPAIAPVVPIVVESEDENSYYIGLGYSSMRLENDLTDEEFSANAVMIQAGYKFHQNLAIEGRYTHHIGDIDYDRGTTFNRNNSDYSADFTNIAIYLKPMYAVDDFTMYALLGYGEVELTDIPRLNRLNADRAESGFQWGLGIDYSFNENISVFIDYVKMYDDVGFDYRAQNADIIADAWTLGVSYKF